MWYDTKKLAARMDAVRARTGNLPPDMREEAFKQDAEEGWEEIEKCVLAFKAGDNILSGGRFDTLSLGTWMEIVKAADLTYVPAEIVALPSGMDIFKSAFAPVKLNLQPEMLKYRGMVRIDNCGSQILKQRQSVRGAHGHTDGIVGAVEIEGEWYFEFDDRTTHGVLEYVGQIGPNGDIQHPIWWRPWVNAIPVTVPRPRFMGGGQDEWPLEWRVIVQRGKIAAVSAYYIQAPVALTPETSKEVSGVIEQSNRLLDFMASKNIQPWHPRYIGEMPEDEISFSFDFISTAHGPAFLEAGPRVPVNENNIPIEVWGAHPCNFIGRKVGGVAFSKDKIIPLSELPKL